MDCVVDQHSCLLGFYEKIPVTFFEQQNLYYFHKPVKKVLHCFQTFSQFYVLLYSMFLHMKLKILENTTNEKHSVVYMSIHTCMCSTVTDCSFIVLESSTLFAKSGQVHTVYYITCKRVEKGHLLYVEKSQTETLEAKWHQF